MTHDQALRLARILNKTRYRKSRISVKPEHYGNTWVLVGVSKKEGTK